ncbi:MAG TPA: sulfur carrier protein ThiS [Nitrospiria bacterium]|jgi:sulfur carrier protein|nr:sulfur carrier protein ThiS [Nitrospiria bacterium]
MRIKINGKPEEIEANTVLELLRAKEIEPRMVSVELNSTIVDREAYAITTLKEGDMLELLFFMGGGGGLYPASNASEWGRTSASSVEPLHRRRGRRRPPKKR